MMHILEMPSQVATLSESFLAVTASKWSLACVLSEVVSQIAAFLENAITARISASEE